MVLIIEFLAIVILNIITIVVFVKKKRQLQHYSPFRHRFVRKWVHRAIIIVIWLIPIVREVAHIFLWEIADLVVINAFLYLLFYAVSLFVICVSCILINIKVRCSRHPQFHSRSKRERKLTDTALIVSLVSLLCFYQR